MGCAFFVEMMTATDSTEIPFQYAIIPMFNKITNLNGNQTKSQLDETVKTDVIVVNNDQKVKLIIELKASYEESRASTDSSIEPHEESKALHEGAMKLIISRASM